MLAPQATNGGKVAISLSVLTFIGALVLFFINPARYFA